MLVRPKIYLSLFFICLAASLPSDLYTASMPIISVAMKCSSYASQLTMTFFILGFALGQFIYGPFSDHYGRKKIILFALLIAVLGSLICCFAQNISMLISGRFLQGLGASACLSIPRAILRDLLNGNKMASATSYLSSAVETITALSPFFGGYIVQHFGWRYNFYILLFMNFITIAIVSFFLDETNLNIGSTKFNIVGVVNKYRRNIFNLDLLYYALCGSIAYSNLMLYFTVSTFLLQNHLHISPQSYGVFTLFVSFSLVIGAILNGKWVETYGMIKMIFMSSYLILFSGFVLSLCAFFSFVNVFIIIFACMISICGSALLFANAVSGALQHIMEDIGIITAIYGGLQILGSFFFINTVTSMSFMPNIEKIAFTFTVLGLILFLSSWIFHKRFSCARMKLL